VQRWIVCDVNPRDPARCNPADERAVTTAGSMRTGFEVKLETDGLEFALLQLDAGRK